MRFVAGLVAASALLAQSVSPVLRVGFSGPILSAVSPASASGSRFTFGPGIEVHLWRGAGVGADLLLRRGEVWKAASPRAGVWRWELPATVVYRFRVPLRPFVRAGISLNRVFGISRAADCAKGPSGERFYCLEGTPIFELRHAGTPGVVLGGGVRFRVGTGWLEPEGRLTHWGDRNFGVRDSAVRSNLNQVGLLVGFVF